MKKRLRIQAYLLSTALFFVTSALAAPADPLPSWNEGPVKKSIIEFVEAVTNQTNTDFVLPKDRIATIDNDGTLWLEQPLYTQEVFMLNRFKMLAETHPDWHQRAPFKAILAKPYKNLNAKDMETIFTATSSNLSVDDYKSLVKKWLASAENPRFKHHYTDLVYQPMLEVIDYLHQNKFRVYIVSGGGQDFMRSFAEEVYHIPPEKIIGSTTKTDYQDANNQPGLIKSEKPLLISDHAGKPEAINFFIGKKPIIAFGNSEGDRQMLEWTQSSKGRKLMLLVHHDDAKREYAYDRNSKIGSFPESLFIEAKNNNWQVISMQNDWKVIFPFETKKEAKIRSTYLI